MSTRSIVAVRVGANGWVGRYVHFDGYDVGNEVRKIIARDGVEKAVQTLVHDHKGWSCVDAEETSSRHSETVLVEGYGVAYTDGPDTLMTAADISWEEYLHVIEPDGSVATTQI